MNTTEIKTITKDELNNKMKSGTHFQLVNVLDPKDYSLGMIQGSRKIPLAELEKRFTELDKNTDVVTYCASSECHASRKAAELLASKGFKVFAYEGGVKEWTAANLPVEGKQPIATLVAAGKSKI